MGRQLPPSHLKVPPGPHTLPPRFLSEPPSVVVSHHRSSSFEKAIPVIPVIPAIPGFRTSATFLTSLSVNLRIDPDLPSPLGTPTTFRASSFSHPPLPPPSPLSFSTLPAPRNPYPSPLEQASIMPSTETSAPAKAPTADTLPTLTTYAAETEDDRIAGLHLVADSVAQQRQAASKQLISHPVNLALYVIAISIAAQFLLRDPLVLATTIGGITMIALACVRYATNGYLAAAEAINFSWLGDDKLIVVKWGEDVIGALVLGWADHDAAKKRGRRRRGKAVVRAWTVKLKYRGKGVGEGLLEEAVRVAGERGADGIVFEGEHANSKRILPSLYNGFLDQKEARAEKALEKVADEKGNFRQRRSSPTWGSR